MAWRVTFAPAVAVDCMALKPPLTLQGISKKIISLNHVPLLPLPGPSVETEELDHVE